MSDLLDRLDEHEFPTADVLLCLKPKLIKKRDAAMTRVASVKRNTTTDKPDVVDDRMATPSVSPALGEAIAAVEAVNDEIIAASITLRITGVDRLQWNRFMLANPPRRGKPESFDPTTFYMYVAKKTATYVDAAGFVHDVTADEWTTIDAKLGDGEYDRLAEAILEVNRSVGAQDVSFFANGSEKTPDSSEISD